MPIREDAFIVWLEEAESPRGGVGAVRTISPIEAKQWSFSFEAVRACKADLRNKVELPSP